MKKPFPVSHETQLLTAGTAPVPDVVGSARAVRPSPPNSPATTPMWVPWATAEPDGPALRFEPVNVWTCSGAVQDPGVPGVNTAWDPVMSAISIWDGLLNSAGAKMIPVEQSSAEESSEPPTPDTACSKNWGEVLVDTVTSS